MYIIIAIFKNIQINFDIERYMFPIFAEYEKIINIFQAKIFTVGKTCRGLGEMMKRQQAHPTNQPPLPSSSINQGKKN